jgi:uncharacterized protein
MQIYDNYLMLIKQISNIIYSPLSRLLVLSCSSQVASMIAKLIIYSIKNKKFAFSNMANYGGMPSSHTVYIMSFVFGTAFDPNLGWFHPVFVLSLVVSTIILVDTVRFRGTVDKLNHAISIIIEKDISLKDKIVLPKLIAHKVSEVISGIIFAFFYTFLFYLLFYHVFK